MSEADPREREIIALLKQISSGLSAYRLYPGNPEQPAFVSAVQRIRATAEAAVLTGTVVVEVQGDRFRSPEGVLPQDESLQRLASACYERQADRLRVRHVPDANELAAVYKILTMKPGEVAAAGGVAAMLNEVGVMSIALTQVQLRASEYQVPEGLTDEQAEMWERLQHGNDILDDPGEDAMDAADFLYGRLRELVSVLPEDLTEDPDLYQRLQGAVSNLPDDTRTALSSKMMHQVSDDPLAQRVLGTMTDADLARTVTDVAQANGSDPVAMAQGLVDSGFRRDDNIVNMTRAALRGGHEAGTILSDFGTPGDYAGLLGAGGAEGLGAAPGGGGASDHRGRPGTSGPAGPGFGPGFGPGPGQVAGGTGGTVGLDSLGIDAPVQTGGRPSPAATGGGGTRTGNAPSLRVAGTTATGRSRGSKGALAGMAMSAPTRQSERPRLTETVSDLLGHELKLSEGEDSRAIRAEFPTTPEQHRDLSMTVLEDYLGLEEDTDRLEKVLELWSKDARDALRRGDLDTALRLVTAAFRSATRAIRHTPDIDLLFNAYRKRVLDFPLLRELIRPGHNEKHVLSVLKPFGADAVDALLDLLGEEEDRTNRAVLLNLLSTLAKDHRDRVVERLSDNRWFLVRNVIVILCKSGAGKDIIPQLEEAARHPHPAVRREAIRGLVPVLQEASIPHLRRAAKDGDESVSTVAVGFLGGINSPLALAALVEVARSGQDTSVRQQALQELAKHPSPGARRMLRQLGSFGSHPRLPWRMRRRARALAKQRGDSA